MNSMAMGQRKILILFLFCSLVLHLIFMITNIEVPSFLSDANKEELMPHEAFKIRVVDQAKQIVENVDENGEVANDAYLGKADNRVDRQTKSRNVDTFKKAGIGSTSNEVSQSQSQSQSKNNADKTNKGFKLSDLGVGKDEKLAKSAALGIKNGDQHSTGIGSSNDYLEDIPLSDFTKLNTQEYKFYGFYHRIRQKLEQFWGNNIRTQAEKLFKQGRHIASGTKLVTSLEIIINERGEIVKVNINGTSGVQELDQASIDAFNQAGPFPNPPKDMLENGHARIGWSFVVNT